MTKATKQTRCGDCKHWSWVALRSDCNEGRCWWSQDRAVPQWADYQPCVFDTDVTPCDTFEAKEESENVDALTGGIA